MNPETPQKPQDELGASLTALLLGELPHEQAAALHQKLAQDAELAKLYERLKHTIVLVRETVARPAAQAAGQPAPLKLSEQRRQKLLQHFKTVAPKAFARPRRRAMRWLVPLGIAAGLVALMVSALLPHYTNRTSSMRHSFGTWSLSMPAESLALAPRAADTPVERRLRSIHPSQSPTPQAAPGQTVKFEPPAALVSGAPPPPPAASHVIVLPQGSELADATMRPLAVEGVNSWTEPAPAAAPPPPPEASSAPPGGVPNAGSLLLGLDAVRSDSANKLADATVSSVETVGYFDVQNANPQDVYNNLQGLFQREKANTQTTSGRTTTGFAWSGGAAQEGESKLALPDESLGYVDTSANWNLGTGNANLPPVNPSSSYNNPSGLFPGSQKAPTAEDRGEARNRPVLRSPKEGGLAWESGGGVVASAPLNPQETAVNEAASRRVVRLPSPQTAPAFKGTPKDAPVLGDLSYVGQLFRNTPGAVVGGSFKADTGTLTTPPASGNPNAGSPSRTYPNNTTAGVAYFSLDPETHRIVNISDEATAKNINDSSKDIQLFAWANQSAAAPAASEDRRKQEAEEAAKQPQPEITITGITAPLKPAANAPIPQPEVQTVENAFSTFSLNVSDVSFKLAAASLEKGVMPEPATVRSEEFINAFDYRDPEPPPGVPVAFAWERAQYPFAQNRDLLRFSIKTAAQGRQPGRPLNLVLLLDNSGSMERADRVQIIHEALRVLAGQLQPQDTFSVVTFARTARLWVDGVPGSQAAQVAEEVSGLTPQGGTNLEDAMNLAYQTALRHYLANGVNRVVLLTDGAANLGDVNPETLKQKVEAHRKQGVALDCFGIGWEGYNDDLLEVLSRNGDGRYAFINTPEEAAGEFAAKLAGALQVAASDVKAQIEFNPGRVTAYRQIGYAKHQLTKEQFRDNTVNAAQIGAAEAGNALYVIAVNPTGDGPLATVRVRFRIPGTSDYREHTWDVPFTGNAVALEQASPALRLAATASAFSEWLVSSPYAAEVTPDRLLGYLSGVPEVYGADARPKKLEWMLRQAKSIAGK